MIEKIIDDYFDIKTNSKDNNEPSTYSFLERLFTEISFSENDCLVDFGCGDGRVLIMASLHNCKHVIGYENNKYQFEKLYRNIHQFQRKFPSDTFFELHFEDVNNIEICEDANIFYFFNPFDLKMFIRVLKKIERSSSKKDRKIYIYLYLPKKNTIEYFNRYTTYRCEICISTTYEIKGNSHEIIQLAVYSNYAMHNSFNYENFII